MEQNNRPRAREKRVTDNGKGVGRKGEGLGTGPVGSSDVYSREEGSGGRHISKGAAIGGGGAGAGSAGSNQGDNLQMGNGQSAVSTDNGVGNTTDSGHKLDTTVAPGSREKRTKILGDNNDKITFMVYMCGTDLESKYGMSTADLNEMASADFGDNINIIVYTGGCNKWKTNGISSKVNQIFQVKKGSMTCLVDDDGNKAMTDPDTLSHFIKWCAENYPANRYELIMWDHGGGRL